MGVAKGCEPGSPDCYCYGTISTLTARVEALERGVARGVTLVADAAYYVPLPLREDWHKLGKEFYREWGDRDDHWKALAARKGAP